MSGNSYRRSGGSSHPNSQKGSGHGYYGRPSNNNNQYYHNNSHMDSGHNHDAAYSNYPPHTSYQNYQRGYEHRYNGHYGPRHNSYNTYSYNSRYHNEPGYPTTEQINIHINPNYQPVRNRNISTNATFEPARDDSQKPVEKSSRASPSTTQLFSSRRRDPGLTQTREAAPVNAKSIMIKETTKKPIDINILHAVKKAKKELPDKVDSNFKIDEKPAEESTSIELKEYKNPYTQRYKEDLFNGEKTNPTVLKEEAQSAVVNSSIKFENDDGGQIKSNPEVKTENELYSPEEIRSEIKDDDMLRDVSMKGKEDDKIETVKTPGVNSQYNKDTYNETKMSSQEYKEQVKEEPEKNGDQEKGYNEEQKRSSIENDNNGERKNEDENEDAAAHDDDDEDDEKVIIPAKRRAVSVEVQSINEESEEETDHEDTVPVPSRKTRRLHRMLEKSTNSDNEKEYPSNKTQGEVTKLAENSIQLQKTRNTSRSSILHPSRSQSPKIRKASKPDSAGRSLLQRMCIKGNLKEVQRLIEQGSPDINSADFAGTTPLHEAALEGFYEIAKILLDHGANVNAQSGDMDKDTPLIDAVSNLHYKLVKLLLTRGANPRIKNSKGMDAIAVLDDLLEDLDDQDADYEPQYHDAKKIRKLLVQYGKNFGEPSVPVSNKRRTSSPADESVNTSIGSDSLDDRIRANDVTYVLNYVSSTLGSSISAESLLLASKLGFPDIASLLIAFGADINYQDKNGWTPLMHAVGKNHFEMVKLLLSNQAKIDLRDKKNRNVLDILRERNLTDSEDYVYIFKKFEEKGLDSSSLSITQTNKKTEANKKTENAKTLEDQKTETLNKVEHEEKLPDDEEIEEPMKRIADELPNKPHKKQKNDEGKPKPLPSVTLMATGKDSSDTAEEKGLLKPKKKEQAEEKSIVYNEPTPDEVEVRRLREIESQKAREALEHQRNERKKMMQRKVAMELDKLQQQRIEEEKNKEREKLERKRKEEEENLKIVKEQEEATKQKAIKAEVDRRKLIRSYYPYGLRQAQFHGTLEKNEIAKYLPLYVFEIEHEQYVVDLQLNLLFGVEDLYTKFPQLSKRKVKYEEKQSIWNFLWPTIGSYKNTELGVAELLKEYKSESEKFNVLITYWTKLHEVEELLKHKEYFTLKECLHSYGYCKASITQSNAAVLNVLDDKTSDTANTRTSLLPSQPVSEETSDMPLRFGPRAREALSVIHRQLW